MTKSKIFLRLFLFLIIFGPLAYLGYLNQGYFLQTTSLNIAIAQPQAVAFDYNTPQLSNTFYWLACLLAGVLLAMVFSIPAKLRSQKQIKALKNENQKLNDEVSRLNESVAALTPSTVVEPEQDEAIEANSVETAEAEPAEQAEKATLN